MEAYVVWLILAFVLLIVELITGTFYVLMVSIAVAAGGVMAWLGVDTLAQYLTAAVVGTVAVFLLRRSRFGRIERSRDMASDPRETLDIGQTVHVREWHEGIARVNYRGTQWDAVLAPGETPQAGVFYIREVRGTRLTVSAHQPA